MTKGGAARSFSRADDENKNYSATMNIAVVSESGSGSTGESNNIQCNIIAKDASQEVVLAQVINVVAETKPDTEVSMTGNSNQP